MTLLITFILISGFELSKVWYIVAIIMWLCSADERNNDLGK